MVFKIVIGFACLSFAIASLHLDKVILKGNKLYNDMNYSYYHDEKQNCHVDFAIRTKAVATRMTIYLRGTVVENDARKGKDIIKTVIDFDNLLNGLYRNPLISGFIKNFMKDLHALNLKTPLPIVRCVMWDAFFAIQLVSLQGVYAVKNVSIDTSFVPLLGNTSGSIEFRVVGRLAGQKTNVFLVQANFFGSYLRLWWNKMTLFFVKLFKLYFSESVESIIILL